MVTIEQARRNGEKLPGLPPPRGHEYSANTTRPRLQRCGVCGHLLWTPWGAIPSDRFIHVACNPIAVNAPQGGR